MAAIEYLTVDHLSTKDLIRIFSKICVHPDLQYNETPCWIWTANRHWRGYGLQSWKGRPEKAHRLFYAWLCGSIPRGREHGELDHLCQRPSCCFPLHLEFVSSKINVLRSNSPTAINARKTHCPRGHSLVPRRNRDKIERYCSICAYTLARERRLANPEPSREYARRYKAKKRTEAVSSSDPLHVGFVE